MRNFVICTVALVLVGIATTAQLSSAQLPAREPEPNVWLYKVVHVKDLVGNARTVDAMVPALEKSLTSAGENGWELCQEINGAVVFKRRK